MDALEAVADVVAAGPGWGGRRLVGIDGRDAAGKTTVADRLAVVLRGRGHEVVRATVDGWHRPRAERYGHGPLSPVGCYQDSFDLERFADELLEPFREGRPCRLAGFDHVEDVRLEGPLVEPPAAAVLLVDGLFLLRPELRAWWDVAVRLVVDPDVALERGLRRDRFAMGGEAKARERYLERYWPAQELYEAEASPDEVAHVLLDATDLDRLVLLSGGRTPAP